MIRLRRTGFAVGVVGLALSDAGMWLRMMTVGDAPWRVVVFWIGALGALAGYTGWLVWLTAVLRHRAQAVGGGALLDGALIGVSSASVFAVAAVLPQLRSTTAELDQLWFLGCLAADAVLLWMGLAVLVTKPASRRARLVLFGIGLHVVVDVLHAAVLGPAGFWRLRAAELLLLVTFAVWGVALRTDDRGSRSDAASRRVAGLRGVGMIVAFAGPGLVVATRLLDHRRDEAYLLAVVVVLTAGLTALRIRGLVADLAASNATLAHQAHHDHLTGVWNRTALSEHLERVETDDVDIRAVIYLDLDGFKGVNDVHGHDAGDAVLIEVAERLQRAVRGADRVARLGGDEFVVVVTDDDTDVEAFVARLDRVLNTDPFMWEGARLDVGASAGVALPSTSYPVFSEILNEADDAMLRAKQERKRTGAAANR